MNFDDAYANGKYIDDADAISSGWAAMASQFRDNHPHMDLDLGYGDHPRQKMDLFYPDNPPVGLAIFIHGGYWMRLDKDSWSHLAAGALAHGYAVMMPSYRLAPEVGLDRIASDVANAVTLASGLIAGPIMLSGHSAGGHLVTRLIAHDGISEGLLTHDVVARIRRVTSISGVHDLRPLIQTEMNNILAITKQMAKEQSPALLAPLPQILDNETIVTCHVGENERPEFRRQTDLQAIIWGGLGLCTDCHHAPGKHHFDVINDLTMKDSRLTKSFVGIAEN